jgi:hypothetical protein
MSSEISIVVADVSRMSAIRERVHLPGRVTHFTSGNLAAAMENIRAHRPKVVAIDALFAQTPSGAAFADRVDALAIAGSTIRLIAQHEGRWVTTPRDGFVMVSGSRPVLAAAPQPAVVLPSPLAVAAVSKSAAVAPATAAVNNTRRAPRFLVRSPVDALVDSGRGSLVDISVLGAQIVSQPALRPSQKIKIGLPDTSDMLHVAAHVAWCTFEKPQSDVEARYRAGLEFTSAAQEALEDYRRRHCADEPISYRGL